MNGAILDDKSYIDQHDPQDALGFVAKQPEQLAYDFGLSSAQFGDIDAVVFAGMGGSALVAELVHTWPSLLVPFTVWKDYGLPAFVNKKTLVICASYSGNTEETLDALDAAEKAGAQIAIISHGGKMVERAEAAGYPLAKLPECPQPRTGVLYAFRALIEIYVAAELVRKEDIDELAELVTPLQAAIKSWQPSVPFAQNQAKQIAEKMVGKTPIIYAGPLMYPAAYKWKIGVNENAKNTAWCNMIPEFNHNEFIGWTSHPTEKPFAIINLLSELERTRVNKRFEVTDRLLSGMRPASVNVQAAGKSLREQLLYLVLLGDYATTYLAILNGVNPTPVALVEKFKKELG